MVNAEKMVVFTIDGADAHWLVHICQLCRIYLADLKPNADDPPVVPGYDPEEVKCVLETIDKIVGA